MSDEVISDEVSEHFPEELRNLLNKTPDEDYGSCEKNKAICPLRRYVPVEVVVALYFLSAVMTLPITQFYIYDQVSLKFGHINKTDESPCDSTDHNSTSYKEQQKIQTETSNWFMVLMFASSFPGILPTIFMGSLTDRYGRKLALICCIVGSLLRQVVYLVVFNWNFSLGYLFIGNVIESASGGFGSMLMAIFGIVADITEVGKVRAFRITIADSTIALSNCVAMAVAGVWIKKSGYLAPVLFTACLSAANLLFVIFILPETRTQRTKEPVKILDTFKKCFQFYTKNTTDKRRWKFIICIVSFFFVISVVSLKLNVSTLFFLNSPFCWDAVKITLYSSFRLLIDWFFIFLLLRFLGHVLPDVIIAVIGCASSLLSCVFTGLANSDTELYIAVAVGLFTEVTSPMIRSIMSKQVSADEQGSMFAGVGVVEMICMSMFGVVGAIIYRTSLDFFPGLIFICTAGILFIVIVLLIILYFGTKKEDAAKRTFVIEISK